MLKLALSFILLFASLAPAFGDVLSYEENGMRIVENVEKLLWQSLQKKNIAVKTFERSLSREFIAIPELNQDNKYQSVNVTYKIFTEKGSELKFKYSITFQFSDESQSYDEEGNTVPQVTKDHVRIYAHYFVKYLNGLVTKIPVTNAKTFVTVTSVDTSAETYELPVR